MSTNIHTSMTSKKRKMTTEVVTVVKKKPKRKRKRYKRSKAVSDTQRISSAIQTVQHRALAPGITMLIAEFATPWKEFHTCPCIRCWGGDDTQTICAQPQSDRRYRIYCEICSRKWRSDDGWRYNDSQESKKKRGVYTFDRQWRDVYCEYECEWCREDKRESGKVCRAKDEWTGRRCKGRAEPNFCAVHNKGRERAYIEKRRNDVRAVYGW